MILEDYHIVGIVGSTTFPNRGLVYEKLSEKLKECPIETAFVSGGAYGVDSFAKQWAEELGPRRSFFMEIHPIRKGENENYFLRNAVIAELADEIVAFIQRGKYRSGTWNTINHFRCFGKRKYIVYDENGESWDRVWKE